MCNPNNSCNKIAPGKVEQVDQSNYHSLVCAYAVYTCFLLLLAYTLKGNACLMGIILVLVFVIFLSFGRL